MDPSLINYKFDQNNPNNTFYKNKEKMITLGYKKDEYFNYEDDKIFYKFIYASLAISSLILAYVVYDSIKGKIF